MPAAQDVRMLTQEQAVKQIIQSVMRAPEGEAPFAFVFGAGLSHGLVPTVKEIITRHLPIWAEANGDAAAYRLRLPTIVESELIQVSGQFWQKFVADNQGRGLQLPLTALGLPEPGWFADAYRAVFCADYDSVIGAPADARKFQRALVQPAGQRRMNASHFLLATLLGAQPGRFQPSDQFRAKGAFSRLILTTNFDSFLRSALEFVGHEYLPSDTPDLGVSDEFSDDETDVIHLVYLHGSVHRRAQAATEEDIRRIKERNAQILAPVLKRRGVIVVGYSGWDDVIAEALSCCEDFNHRLYWCGRAPDPLAPGAFGPRVPEILRKRSAYYVQTDGAAQFMHLLNQGLVQGLPQLLTHFTARAQQMLQSFDFSELSEVTSNGLLIPSARVISVPAVPAPQSVHSMEVARTQALEVLRSMSTVPSTGTERATGALAVGTDRADQLMERARLALGCGAHSEALTYCSEALRFDVADPNKLATLCYLRAQAHLGMCQYDEAIEQCGTAVQLLGVPWPLVASIRVFRAKAFARAARLKEALEDFNHIIARVPEMDDLGIAVETVAAALLGRAEIVAQSGKEEAEYADCSRIIEDRRVSESTRATALYRRAGALLRQERFDEARLDFDRFIKMPEANKECLNNAIVERGRAIAGMKREGEELQTGRRLHDRPSSALIDGAARAVRPTEMSKTPTSVRPSLDPAP